jgi:hypothetical protein
MADSSGSTLSMPDLSSDLVAFVAVTVIVVMGPMYTYDHPFRNMYIMGMVGATFIAFKIGKKLGY